LTEVMERNFPARRKELEYDASRPVMRLLIDQLLLAEMRLAQFELEHSNKTASSYPFAVSGDCEADNRVIFPLA
jgi:hypothetical protein